MTNVTIELGRRPSARHSLSVGLAISEREILSAKKLREKYDQMKVAANASYKKKKTEKLPDWAEGERNVTETPMDPEEQRAIEERISRLKSSGKNSEAG